MSGVRALGAADLGAVLQLNAAAGSAVFRLDATELARLMRISSLHLVAIDAGGGPIGYALAFLREHDYDGEEFRAFRSARPGPFLYIDQVVVAAAARGTGVGRALYETLATLARAAGAGTLCCEVNTTPPNPGSLAFHRRMGFATDGSLDTADGRTVALLRRTLEP